MRIQNSDQAGSLNRIRSFPIWSFWNGDSYIRRGWCTRKYQTYVVFKTSKITRFLDNFLFDKKINIHKVDVESTCIWIYALSINLDIIYQHHCSYDIIYHKDILYIWLNFHVLVCYREGIFFSVFFLFEKRKT